MNEQSQTPGLSEIKESQRQTWASGDYAMLGTTLLIISELLCETVDLRSGQRVLDVATGSGNTALAAARRFCDVTGVDYVPALLERGRERGAAERLEIVFCEGDAENLPFPETSFDVVLSTLGVMFAPDQEKAASELLRVCRPGGKIGLANWTPDSFVGELFRVFGRYVPPPPGLLPPALWGTEERLRELFGHGVTSVQIARRSFAFRYRSPRHYLEFTRTYVGPALKGFEALDPAGRENLSRDLLDLISRFDISDDETMLVPSYYIEAVLVKR